MGPGADGVGLGGYWGVGAVGRGGENWVKWHWGCCVIRHWKVMSGMGDASGIKDIGVLGGAALKLG